MYLNNSSQAFPVKPSIEWEVLLERFWEVEENTSKCEVLLKWRSPLFSAPNSKKEMTNGIIVNF